MLAFYLNSVLAVMGRAMLRGRDWDMHPTILASFMRMNNYFVDVLTMNTTVKRIRCTHRVYGEQDNGGLGLPVVNGAPMRIESAGNMLRLCVNLQVEGVILDLRRVTGFMRVRRCEFFFMLHENAAAEAAQDPPPAQGALGGLGNYDIALSSDIGGLTYEPEGADPMIVNAGQMMRINGGRLMGNRRVVGVYQVEFFMLMGTSAMLQDSLAGDFCNAGEDLPPLDELPEKVREIFGTFIRHVTGRNPADTFDLVSELEQDVMVEMGEMISLVLAQI